MAHGNNTIPIPGELRSEATEGVVASADAIKDYKKGKFQEQVNEEVSTEIENIKGGSTDSIASLKTAINNEKNRAQNVESGLQNSINTEKNRAEGAESNLQDAVNVEKARAEGVEATKANVSDVYTKAEGTAFEGQVDNTISQQNTNIANKFAQQDQVIDERLDAQDEKIDTLEKQDVKIVENHEAVENPDPKTIYREPSQDGTSYTDWMYQDGWIELVTYSFPGIDEEPEPDSENLAKSGGIAGLYGHYEENPEYMKVELDNEGKVIRGTRNDGVEVLGAGYEIGGIVTTVLDNPEFLMVYLDEADRILWGIRKDGSVLYGNTVSQAIKDYVEQMLQPIREKLETIGDYTDNPEFVDVKTDKCGKILEAIRIDGTKILSAGVEFGGNKIGYVSDPEGRSEITTDGEGKILSYRNSEGIKVENNGFKTNHLELEGDAPSDLAAALDKVGYTANNPSDWSDSEFVEIPIPEVCAVVNIEVDGQAEAKSLDIPTYIQFWDKKGNYFRKPVELNAQGSSSMRYHIKNQAIDFTDGSKIKFGNWPAFDSFHIKKYYIDVFRGQCIVAYWLTEQMYQTRPYGEKRPWDYLNQFSDYDKSNGSFAKDFESGALAHPDGFPVHVFFNGKDAGIYAFNIKKARDNYNMKKNKQKQIILDGILGGIFWTANGDLRQPGEDGAEHIWDNFEIRNPKIDKDINGNKYDGDNPKEPSDDFAITKAAIERLTTAIPLTLAEQTAEAQKTKFAEFFNIPFLIDYELISQLIFNFDGYKKNWIWCCWDGNLWCPTSYDMDSIFGQHWNGASYEPNSTTDILGSSNRHPTGYSLLKGLYTTELRSRYKELRDKGIFTVDNITELLDKWVKGCGYDNLKHDIEDIVTSPYLVNGSTVVDEDGNPVLVPNTPSYRDGEKTYVYPPQEGGWYNSIQRVKNWLVQRISRLDSYYNYIQN